MKNGKKLIYIAAVLALAIIIAVVAYNSLADKYSPVSPSIPEQSDKQVTQAADFTVLDCDGNTVRLSDKFGKPIVVNMWATWCGPCRMELPAFNSAYEKYGDRVNFMMVDLTDGYRDTIDGAKAFVAENGYTFPLYFDTEASGSMAYSAHTIPLTVLINADGTLFYSQIGAMDESELTAYIEEMLAAM